MANQTIDFKDPLWITAWLDTALEKEQEKYKKCPVMRDIVPGHEMAQAWGYVVAGYFLVEESFKALLYIRNKRVPTKHSLTQLFDLFEADDKETLREFYTDWGLGWSSSRSLCAAGSSGSKSWMVMISTSRRRPRPK